VDPTVSSLFADAHRGDQRAADALFAAFYAELHRLAKSQLARSAGEAPLSTTTLLHEADLGMARNEGAVFPDRGRFMAYAARVMRGLIIDSVRSRQSQKRGGEFEIIALPEEVAELAADAERLVRIGKALDELAAVEPQLAEVVDLKFFCGFSLAEIPAHRGVAERTVQRHWEKARYASVNAFGDDLRRVLDHQPVAARPGSALSRAVKFARRHRGGVGGGRRGSGSGPAPRSTPRWIWPSRSPRGELERAASRLAPIARDTALDPVRRAGLLYSQGRLAMAEDDPATARSRFAESAEAHDAFPFKVARSVKVWIALAGAQRALGEVEPAAASARHALELAESLVEPGARSYLIGLAHAELGAVEQARGHEPAAESAFAVALDHLEPTLGAGHPETQSVRRHLGG
jgi:RNA polymerase sigma factor (TIGR02999 family)